MPPPPPTTEDDRRSSEELSRQLERTIRAWRQVSLDDAVRLAEQATRGEGDLVDHFCELGRRFGRTLRAPKPAKAPKSPKLLVIDGGA